MDRNDYISDEQVVIRANAAVQLALEKKKVIKAPIIVYNRSTGTICNMNEDGTLVEVGKRRTVGRYSERNRK